MAYLRNLGSVLVDLGDLAGARTHHERTLEIGQATLGADHSSMVTFRANLDMLCSSLVIDSAESIW